MYECFQLQSPSPSYFWQQFGSESNNEPFVCHNAFLFITAALTEEDTNIPHTWFIVCIERKEHRDSENGGESTQKRRERMASELSTEACSFALQI